MNLIGVTLSTGAVQVHCNGASETLAAVALSAGTVTGFRLNYGTLLYNEQGAYHSIVVYNKALSVGEVASVFSWGRARGAIYPADSDVIQQLYMTGASRAVGYHPSGNLSHGRQIAAANPKRLFRIGAFGGISIPALQTRSRVEYGLLGEGSSYSVGTRWNNPTKRQVVIMEIPTADTSSSVASATQITNLTAIRQEIKCSGYDLLMNAMPYANSWSGAQRTICDEINAAMAALDTRRYGKFHALPTELSDPSNLTYFNADGVHYTKAGYDVLYNENKVHIESMFTRPVSTLKGIWTLNGDYLDNSGYSRDLTAINSPTFVAGLNGQQCLQCAATGSHAARQHAPFRCYDYLPLTVVAWVNQYTGGADSWFVAKEADAGGSKVWNLYRKNSTSQLRSFVTDLTAELIASDKTYSAGTWYGMALQLDNSGGKLYTTDAGGDATTFALRDTKAWSATPTIPNAGTGRGHLRIGCTYDTFAFNVKVQSPQIYLEALSLSQLQALSPGNSTLSNVGIFGKLYGEMFGRLWGRNQS